MATRTASTPLRELRRQRGLSQAALATAALTQQQHVHAWESGVEPKVRAAVRVARALGVPVEAVWSPDEKPEQGARAA